MIEIRDVNKRFGLRTVLRAINVTIEGGESVVLAGPNGAGKTTLLRMLANLSRPTSGTITIAGLDTVKDAVDLRRKIGFLSHRTLLYENLTARQNLLFYARLYDLNKLQDRIDDLLARVELHHRQHDLVRTFSRGMKQRLAIARAVLHEPTVLLLDEPYTGLDPFAAASLNGLLRGFVDRRCTLLMTTHQIAEGIVGERALILYQGQILDDGPLDDRATFLKRYQAVIADATEPAA